MNGPMIASRRAHSWRCAWEAVCAAAALGELFAFVVPGCWEGYEAMLDNRIFAAFDNVENDVTEMGVVGG